MSRIGCLLAATACAGMAVGAAAQGPNAEVRAYVKAHQQAIMREYLAYVSVPDLHGDLPNLARNADLLMTMLERRGLHPELWKTAGASVVYGEKMVPGATRTILFYIHYDGQPVDAKRWAQPDPFIPVIRTDSIENGGKVVTDVSSSASIPDPWRIYARAAGDDKVPIEALLCAFDAIGDKAKSNIKIFLHGEEEGSGPSQAEVIRKYPDKLKSDLLVILDGPQHPSGRPTIFYGARGGANLEVTVYTAKNGMHSGNYGNWMPDANVRLSQLISSMVDATGKVVVDGFYSDVLPFSKSTLAMIQAVPDNTAQMQKDYGVGSTDGAATSLQEGLNLPAFSVHTMHGGEVGGVIPASATAEIAMRLVKDDDPKTMVQRVIEHIRRQGYFVVTTDPDVATLASHPRVAKVTSRTLTGAGGSGAWRTDPEQPQAAFITAAMNATWPGQVVRVRTLGGSVPASPFIDAFHVPTVGISLANYDDNQHSDNENLRVGNLWDGIVTLAGIITYSGK
jgi:acetylornithine deacetylase/succinyl-diaminopimelate desuccinylase-like protein